ncbi:Auxilin-like protein [Quillaja saponaria]|uniref:Auxilin-like protein n=1 Tax=Quillaja saponaria TaxID=32244 RepID=A0AAD7KS91_QUISA|nr:Auxilin-like protein [Quillaja saponaria]
MNDFDGLLATDFGFKPQGKSAPMAASKGSSNTTTGGSPNFDLRSRGASRSTRNSNSFNGSFMDDGDVSLFGSSGSQKNQDMGGIGDLFGGSARYTSKSESRGGDASFNFDSMFSGSSNSGAKSMDSPPVYDKPVYDDDIFDGIPGIKSSSKVKYDNVFTSSSSAPQGSDAAFDDLLGGFGKAERETKGSSGKRSERNEKGVSGFDDLLPGFGRSSSPSDRPKSDAAMSSEPTVSESKKSSNVTEDPFKVFESASPSVNSSSGHFTDPLDEISKLSSSGSTKVHGSSVSNGRVYDDIDPFEGLGKSVPAFSTERNSRNDGNPSRSDTSSSWTRTSIDKEPVHKSSVSSPERGSQKKIPHDREFHQTPFNIHAYSSDSNKPVGKTTSPPSYNNTSSQEANIQVDMSPKYEENLEPTDDVWLTVSEIPLFTQPTTAPPPSRPPPPRPVQVSKSVAGSPASTNARKKTNQFSSFPTSNQFSQAPKSAPATTATPFDEFEDFAMGRNHSNDDEQTNSLPSEELEMNSVADAMKEAMDRAEAKFRHAKEVRERESTKAARSKEAVQLEKDGIQDERERQERLDHERLQKEREREEREQKRLEREREEKEREQRRLEKEKERAKEIEREREKARQAVERATREARERAAAEARSRAERAAVGKVNAEARERAERAAVQRAQAEARERAAAEAKERAERVAAEARERASTEAKEKEARERAAAARAEAEARVRAERAAVERAAAEARERAAAASRMNQQKNENDLESFFSSGRASSAPRPRASSSSDSVYESQFQNRQEPDVTKKSGAASSNIRKASSSTNIVDDLSSIFGGSTSAGVFQEFEGETEERQRARLERHQRAEERAQKALAEKNQRDLQTQREQAERHRISETLDVEVKRWAAGKEGNLRALLSTLQYVLWPESGWQPVSLTDLITAAQVKKFYRKATLCIHPDKVQQKGANLQQKYIAEKEAWNKLNSEELF